VAALLLALLRGAPARWRYAVCAFSLALCLGCRWRSAWTLPQRRRLHRQALATGGADAGPRRRLGPGGGAHVRPPGLGLAWVCRAHAAQHGRTGQRRPGSMPSPAAWA
jgi:D-alanyl-D-alanine endopeptidase (penicillin-binding protein 7)